MLVLERHRMLGPNVDIFILMVHFRHSTKYE